MCMQDEKGGAPGAIPTRDLPLRRRTLYATELREQTARILNGNSSIVKLRSRIVPLHVSDATALRRGGSRSQLNRTCGTHPLDATAQGRGIRKTSLSYFVATSVNLHGARPWHPENFSDTIL